MENRQGSPAQRGPGHRAGAKGMMRVENLTFRYGSGGFLLQVPDLNLQGGRPTALVGPSGTGKTTLLHLLAGILKPLSGLVHFEGLELSSLGEADRRDVRALRIGLVFQEFELLEYLSVLDNILLPYRISPVLTLNDEVIKRARSLATSIGLAQKLDRLPTQLSQGERQRIAVCRALITNPSMVFGDEPTGNLDVRNRDYVMDLLFRYAKENDAGLLIVTHDPELQKEFEETINIADFTHG